MAAGPWNLPGLVNVYGMEVLVGHFLQEETINAVTLPFTSSNPERLIILICRPGGWERRWGQMVRSFGHLVTV